MVKPSRPGTKTFSLAKKKTAKKTARKPSAKKTARKKKA